MAKHIQFDNIVTEITQAHFDHFTCGIIGRRVPIEVVDGNRYCIILFSSKDEAEKVFKYIQESASNAFVDMKGVKISIPFRLSFCLSKEEEEAKRLRHEKIRQLELEKHNREERRMKRRERRAQREAFERYVSELEDEVEVMTMEEEVRQDEERANVIREEELEAECKELQARITEEKSKAELRALKQERSKREKIKADTDRLRIAAQAYDLEIEAPNWTDNAGWKAYENVIIESYYVTGLSKGSVLKKGREEKGEMRIKAKPFERGTFRLAYYAQLKRDGKVENMVAKAFILPDEKKNDMDLLASIESQLLARDTAKKFCEVNKGTSIEFVEGVVVRVPGKSSYFVEPHLPTAWKRFTNNIGEISGKECAPTVLAFCHFSYQISGEHTIVVDIQGTRTPSGYLLSDPAIHCKSMYKFGATNFGSEGFDKFFSSHACNLICKKLGLTKHPKQTLPDNTDPIPASQ